MSSTSRWEANEMSELEHQYKPYFEKLDNSKWEKLPYNERKEVLQKVEEFEAKKSNRSPASFQTRDGMPLASRGYYSPSSNTITQNYQYTMANSSEASLKNVLHEGRHAYQWDCVNNPQKHPEVDPKQIEEWKSNFENYISASKAEDKMQYYMQPVEQDARSYADSEVEKYSKYQSQGESKHDIGRWEKGKEKSSTRSSTKNDTSNHNTGKTHIKR